MKSTCLVSLILFNPRWKFGDVRGIHAYHIPVTNVLLLYYEPGR